MPSSMVLRSRGMPRRTRCMTSTAMLHTVLSRLIVYTAPTQHAECTGFGDKRLVRTSRVIGLISLPQICCTPCHPGDCAHCAPTNCSSNGWLQTNTGQFLHLQQSRPMQVHTRSQHGEQPHRTCQVFGQLGAVLAPHVRPDVGHAAQGCGKHCQAGGPFPLHSLRPRPAAPGSLSLGLGHRDAVNCVQAGQPGAHGLVFGLLLLGATGCQPSLLSGSDRVVLKKLRGTTCAHKVYA